MTNEELTRLRDGAYQAIDFSGASYVRIDNIAVPAFKAIITELLEHRKRDEWQSSFRQSVQDALYDFDLVADGTPESDDAPATPASKQEIEEALRTFVVGIRYALQTPPLPPTPEEKQP